MAGIVVERLRVIYWPIPKNACTALKRHFAQVLGLKVPLGSLIHDVPFRWTSEPITGYRNLVVVRNPFSRLYSLWANKIADGHPESSHFVDHLDVHVFSESLRLMLYSGMPFGDFVSEILNPETPADPHWAPQSSLVPEEVTEYIQLEKSPLLSLLIAKENCSHLRDHWNLFYNSSLRSLVRKYYEADFKRFCYDE